ncbi:facilitated trehalose transporter Tret1-like [Leptinotarsa decemlineata]|uniref:facilitated trehalose transporter Tret1-like n=1 Tax=Leptinotarsa decemlineata TaxID=7539 RepID=UPI003D30CFBC
MKEQVEKDKLSHVFEEVVYIPSTYDLKDQELSSNKKNKSDTAFLYFSALTALLVTFTFGCNLVWTSPVLPKLKDSDPNVNPLGEPIETSQISLMVGLPPVLSLLSTFFVAKLPDIIGRRETMKYMSIGMIISNIAVAFGTHIYIYYVAKTVFYIFAGSALTAVQVYMSEIVEDHNRGKFGCLMGVALPLGNLYSFVVGPVTSVRDFTLLCTLPPVISLIFFYTSVPESPVYLAMKGRKEETIRALTKLRNNKSSKEIEQDYSKIEDLSKTRTKSEKHGFVNLFNRPVLRKAMMVALVANMTQHLSGVAVIMPFLGPLFTEAGTQLSGNTVAIIVGIVKVSVFYLTTHIVERIGRRPLLLFSSCSSGIPLFLLGLYFFWKNNNSDFIENIRLLPIVSILTYVVVYSLGLGPIPMAMIGELFPSDIKSVATTFIMTIVTIVITIMSTAYPLAAEYFGVQWCIWTFSFFCFLGSFFIYFKLPETKGKSINEIEEILSR